MAKEHKPHRGAPAWKRDILLLTCVLRLQVQPSVPYAEIGSILLLNFPNPILHLYEKAAPREVKESYRLQGIEGILSWLKGWLQQRFEYAEQWGSEAWLLATNWDKELVSKVLRICGLFEKGYDLVDEREMLMQIQWRREGDWREGSEPVGKCGRPRESEILSEKFVVGPPRRIAGEEAFKDHKVIEEESVKTLLLAPRNDWELLGRLKMVSEKYREDPNILKNRELQKQPTCEEERPEVSAIQRIQIHGPRSVKSALLNPTTSESIRFDTPQHPFRFREHGLGYQALSQEARMHSCWNSFSDQLEEIRVLEGALKARTAPAGGGG